MKRMKIPSRKSRAALSVFSPFLLLLQVFTNIQLENKSIALATKFSSTCFVTSLRCHSTPPPSEQTIKARPYPQPVLLASSTDNNNEPVKVSKSARERGIYSRPSAVIERGSGFFIPGLEGSRIRFVFGLTALLATVINHFLVEGSPQDFGQIFAEFLAAFYALLLITQGFLEFGLREREVTVGSLISGVEGFSTGENHDKSIHSDQMEYYKSSEFLMGDEDTIKSIQRAAETFINLTPATYFKLVDDDVGVLLSFSVCTEQAMNIDLDQQRELIKLAVNAVSRSRSGRVALAVGHPVSKLLPQSATRCILIQKVKGYKGKNTCWIVGSNRLLPSYTKNDLRWLGQLAEYCNIVT